jgi:uncharacterized membrane protein YoaT (DUF817 family)
MKELIKHDLLLLLKIVLYPVFLLAMIVSVLAYIIFFVVHWTVGFQLPIEIASSSCEYIEKTWKKLPKFGANEF